MFRALFRLFVNEILFLFVTPPNVISRPLFVSSTTILSHAMEPTFVMFPSLRSRDPPVISPEVVIVDSPISIDPKPELIEPLSRVPTFVIFSKLSNDDLR